MKRFWKISTAIICTLAGIGLVSLILGSLFGGIDRAVQLLKTESDIGSESGPGDDNESGGISLEDTAGTEVARCDEVAGIRLETDHCEVLIEKTAVSAYEISAVDVEKLDYDVSGGVLTITADDEETQDGLVVLHVPESAAPGSVDIEMGSGILTASRLTADTVSVETGMGTVAIDGLLADSAQLQVGTGTMEVMGGDVTDLVIEAGMGNFSYEGMVRGDVEATCGMGVITMEIAGEQEDFNYKTACMLGGIAIGDAEPAAFQRELDYGADQDMELDCSMGLIEVTFYGSEREE